MKALVLSDSHGWKKEIADIISRHKDSVDIIFHCGDSELEKKSPELQGIKVVKGNCDYADFAEDIIETVSGVTFYITHGHLYNVKMTHVPLSYRAEEVGATVACFGHSHVATSFEENGVIYINPGSIRLPRGRKEQTYCICEVDEQITVRFFERGGNEVKDMRKIYARKKF
ncbi:metallophosphoesterase family protein [Bacillus alkalicellulosilyticus]|uniref:metallophosphoesterase family protein n=1 Tax=Alkalihalobacterium alkalicellulosilyticum TaxID=1912214 RepID=UPI000996997D|nr:metallophosphoesterase [Bacillus alkalicellulosilyticus]